ncbi:MAG: DEAD/DEAH box helicase [Bacteroidota bacterium]
MIDQTLTLSTEEILQKRLDQLQTELPKLYVEGSLLHEKEACKVLAFSKTIFDLWAPEEDLYFSFLIENEEVFFHPESPYIKWDPYTIAGLLALKDSFLPQLTQKSYEHKQYTRQGMIERVLDERRKKALKEEYRFQWADNIHGDHFVFSPSGQKYKVFLRDFEKEIGYSDNPDSKINKLGTSKHIMAAFHHLKENKKLFNKLDKTFPFIEVFLDPVNDNCITWHYPDELETDEKKLIEQFFESEKFIYKGDERAFTEFIDLATDFERIVIRPEVIDLLEKICRQDALQWVSENYDIPYDQVNADLFDYQKKGVEFITYKEGCILADEMGLGKTLQAITSAIAKKEIFGFKKTLIVCPASLKDQWKKEIEKFTNERAINVIGTPEERAHIYENDDSYFFIVNYETVLRDSRALNHAGFDYLILDEAQRIKNFETKTASAIKRLEKSHVLVLTGTPIENRLTDLFSIMQVVDDEFLGPLWEFSYQHCLFDYHMVNKINGYYDLHVLKKRLKPVLLRREKKSVIEELPHVSTHDIMVPMTALQGEYHSSYAKGVSQIIHKKFKTPMDYTRLQQLLNSMRMVCDSTYLVDEEEPYESPKLDELEHILIEKMDVLNSDRKIIIFSEWHKSHELIAEMLKKHHLKHIAFSGKIPVKQRGEYIKKFEEDKECKFFLSTESGGAGLNLQVADTLINFELPWNPAKKNQRIGRIDRLGQQNKHLTVINFITANSIEVRIASGIMLKENLFEGVLNKDNTIQVVDFSDKGRAQFLEEMGKMAESFIQDQELEEIETIDQVEENELVEEALQILKEQEPEETTLQTEPIDEKVQHHDVLTEASGEEKKEAPEEKLEEVLQQGMGFFSGLYQMATGTTMQAEDQKIEVNKETGEVTMKFKLPGFGA